MIEGLIYEENFVSEAEEQRLLDFINRQEWSEAISRRTQHYGYKYSYERAVHALEPATPIPVELQYLVEKLNAKFHKSFTQLIVNEYKPGQGISAHIDNTKMFGDIVVSISLGSTYPMKFSNEAKEETISLARRSLVALTGDARYAYKHSIAARKKDDGIARGTRISMTFRTVVPK